MWTLIDARAHQVTKKWEVYTTQNKENWEIDMKGHDLKYKILAATNQKSTHAET